MDHIKNEPTKNKIPPKNTKIPTLFFPPKKTKIPQKIQPPPPKKKNTKISILFGGIFVFFRGKTVGPFLYFLGAVLNFLRRKKWGQFRIFWGDFCHFLGGFLFLVGSFLI
jgi:hypothetical protein